MNTTINYEFPLNERIRVFIRLEQLFRQFSHFSTGVTVADKRSAINTLLDIMMIFRRNDLKSEILKELDRDTKVLQGLANENRIEPDKWESTQIKFAQMSKRLYAINGKIGLQVMESELFQSIAQRSAIPGGSCSFDLPEYHYWLEQEEVKRLHDLQQWSAPFNDIRTAIDLILGFIRGSGTSTHETATAGFFQVALDHSLPYQLLKVSVDKSVPYFAEISGGKHRCTVRFMTPPCENKRSAQSTDTIPFTLTCCVF